jgi:hypothetical protein
MSTRIRVSSLAGLAVGLALSGHAAPAAAATFRCVQTTHPACQASFTTIGAAVAASAATDIILVGPGTYAEQVVIDNTRAGLTLLGAQAGVDARTGRTDPAQESVVDATSLAGSAIIVQATGVVIDGFTVRGGINGNATGIDLKGSGGSPPGFTPANGARVLNNIVRDNSTGLSLNSEGFGPVSDVVVRGNLFLANNAGTQSVAGNAIFTSACQAVVITSNKFMGHQRQGIGMNNSSGVSITANESVQDARFVVFTGTVSSELVGNVVRDVAASSFFSSARAAGILVGFGNARLTISDNDVAGGTPASTIRGIQFGGYGPAPTNSNLTVTYNRVRNMPFHGMVAEASMLTGSLVQGNVVRFSGSDASGGDGVTIAAGNAGNFLTQNVSRFNEGVDCRDSSTGTGTSGTANTWFRNAGSSSPPGLCNR